MKQYLLIVVLLTVVANSQCGLIDGLLGTVKDTTHSITSNVGGALHYGKSMIFGSSETNATGYTVTKPGIVGRVSHKIHDVSQGIRNEIRNIFSITDNNDAHVGLVSKVLNKLKKCVLNMKDLLFGTRTKVVYKPIKVSNDTNTLCDKLRKYILRKNASGSNSSGLMQTILSLQDAIDRIRNNITKNKNEPNGDGQNEDGTGLIDIRTSINDLNNIGEDPYGIYPSSDALYPAVDKVADTISRQTDKVDSSLDSLKQSTNDFIKDQKFCDNKFNELNDGVNKLKSNLDSSLNSAGSYIKAGTDKAADEMKNSYNNINNRVTDGANKIKNNMDNAINDAGIHFRDETEDAADAVNNAYKKVDFNAKHELGGSKY